MRAKKYLVASSLSQLNDSRVDLGQAREAQAGMDGAVELGEYPVNRTQVAK